MSREQREEPTGTLIGYKRRKADGLKGGVHGSAHVHESKYFFAFARYDPSLFSLIRCLWTIRKGIGTTQVVIFSLVCVILHANNCKHINRRINSTGPR